MRDTERELLWLRRARDLSQALARETRLDRLLPRVLEAAIEITEAERGFLVRVEQGDPAPRVRVEAARGFNKTQLRGKAGEVSRTVVERVLASERGLVTTREEDADVLDASSILRRRVLAIICVPLRLRGSITGVLYLDHRFRADAFDSEDLPALSTFADQAALAIETAELRAERARLNASLRELEALRAGGLPGVESEDGDPPAPQRGPVRFGGLVGVSPPMCAVYEGIERAARTWDPVLVSGEGGSGKSLVAYEIHARSQRPREPFVVQGCAAVSQPELERELFAQDAGALLRAGGGTLVLDEVGDLPPPLQAKLATVLRERFIPGARARPIACRIIATSARDLRGEVKAGRFREDLYYRLDVQRIRVPSLRERPEDLPLLTDHLARVIAERRLELSDAAARLLRAYAWPGNVLELRNELQRLLALDQERITRRHLSPEIREGRGVARAAGTTSGKTLGQVEREMVVAALRDAGGNKARAARQLGIPRSSLYSLLERYGLR